MKNKNFLILIFFSLFGNYLNAQVYVSTSGVDAPGRGTQPLPYLTIRYAVANSASGAVVNVSAGLYPETGDIYISVPKTIKRFGPGEVIIDAYNRDTVTGFKNIITVAGASNVLIDSLTLRNCIGNGCKAVYVLGSGTNVTISNCKISNIGWADNNLKIPQYNPAIATSAIAVLGTAAAPYTSIKIKNNKITNCATGWGEAITIKGNVDTFYVQNNVVDSIANIGIVAAGNYGTATPAGLDQARNGLISNNSVSNCMSGNAAAAGIYLDGSRNCIVEKNKCFKNGAGISVGAEQVQGTNLVTGHIVRNNLIYKNSIAAMYLGSSTPGNKVANSYIVNNTFFKNVTADTINGIDSLGPVATRKSVQDITNESAGEILMFNCDLDTFQNNIIYTLVNPVGRRALVGMSNGTETNFGINFNLYYHEDITPLFFFAGGNSFNGISGPQTYPTIADFSAAPARQDSNSVFANPSFMDTSVYNFQLKPCSYAIDRGNPFYNSLIHGAKDYIDSNRVFASGHIDCGAHEYPACYIASLAGATGGSQVCVSNSISNYETGFFDASCNFVNKIMPSGASPVNGGINACVIVDGTVQTFNAAPYVQRHYDIEPAINPNTSTATITLCFKDQEFVNYNFVRGGFPALPTLAGGGNSDVNRSRLRITQYHGVPVAPHNVGNPAPGYYSLSTSTLIIPDTVIYNNTCGYWEVRFKVNGFSGFYIHTNDLNVTLPIAINYLSGRRQGSDHLLNWKVTCTSTPRATMELQRSADGRNFSGIYSIIADAARCQQPFDYTDASPLKGMNYYRLKITDADGKVTYSTTVALLNEVKGFELISIAPNPVVDGNTKLNLASAQAGKLEMMIYDMQGRLMKIKSFSVLAGFNSLPIQVNDLAAGTYTIRINVDGSAFKTVRFVKQ